MLTSALLLMLLGGKADAESFVGDICRIKGQESNTLHGMGIVVGLNGTGDGSFTPTISSLAQILKVTGVPIGTDAKGNPLLTEMKNAKNIALVAITVEIPPQGARQGDELNCTVASVAAKSLQGGILLPTPLLGPGQATNPGHAYVYAFTQGRLQLEDKKNPGNAVIPRGCRLEHDFFNSFFKDGKITLVLNKNHASFTAAQDIQDLINRQPDFLSNQNGKSNGVAKAIDQVNIEVLIPDSYKDDPVLFASLLLKQRMYHVPTESRVVVNERTGAISISADLEIAPVAVTHNNMVIDVGNGQLASQFVELYPGGDVAAPGGDAPGAKLKSLVTALNALRVSAKEQIEIIRNLDEQGAIMGEVIYVR